MVQTFPTVFASVRQKATGRQGSFIASPEPGIVYIRRANWIREDETGKMKMRWIGVVKDDGNVIGRTETVSAYDWRDRIGDFCVADYLAELDKVHPVRYSTRFSLRLHRTRSCLPTSDNHGENALRRRSAEDLGAIQTLPRTCATQAQPKSALGFQIEIKENKTPGDEHYLDPPGAELLAWSKN